MTSKTFADVQVFRKAYDWVLGVYRFSEMFPKHELFGLASQLRRAAVSVPANFAEGFKRESRKEKVRFFNIAQASLEESRLYLMLSSDLGYGDCGPLMSSLQEISRMLEGYVRATRADRREHGRPPDV